MDDSKHNTVINKPSRVYTGKVISDVRDKTITVLIERRVKHRLYGKILKQFKKCHAHDPHNQYKVGDVVSIKETKPISKTKCWLVISTVNN